jgi:hypothetical protein
MPRVSPSPDNMSTFFHRFCCPYLCVSRLYGLQFARLTGGARCPTATALNDGFHPEYRPGGLYITSERKTYFRPLASALPS